MLVTGSHSATLMVPVKILICTYMVGTNNLSFLPAIMVGTYNTYLYLPYLYLRLALLVPVKILICTYMVGTNNFLFVPAIMVDTHNLLFVPTVGSTGTSKNPYLYLHGRYK